MMKSHKHFRDPAVRDLAWAIGSAPLLYDPVKKSGLNIIDYQWIDERYYRHLDWLEELDSAPTRLHQFLDNEHIELVGKRFESLIKFWLSDHPDFELLCANIQFFEDKKTVGEIDFIVRDTWTDEIFQLEIACKYYFAHSASADWNEWWGPNHQDKLALKMQKFHAQTALLKSKQGKEVIKTLGYKNIPSAILLKGYLFFPFNQLGTYPSPHLAYKKHASGWFVKRENLGPFQSPTSQWVVLPKQYWLAPYHSENNTLPIINGEELFLQANASNSERAILVAQVLQDENGFFYELNRGLITR